MESLNFNVVFFATHFQRKIASNFNITTTNPIFNENDHSIRLHNVFDYNEERGLYDASGAEEYLTFLSEALKGITDDATETSLALQKLQSEADHSISSLEKSILDKIEALQTTKEKRVYLI